MKHFENVGSMAELNQRRSEVLADINKEYQEVRQQILTKTPPFKKLPIVVIGDIPVWSGKLHAFIGKSHDGTVPNNTLVVSSTEAAYRE